MMLAVVVAAAFAALAGQTGSAPSLVGPTWVAVELGGKPVPSDPARRPPSIAFVANQRAAGTDGCNRVSAPYTLDGPRLTFGPMIATRMACPGTEEVAQRFEAALRETTRWRIADGRLELRGAGERPLAIFTPRESDAPPQAGQRPLKSQVFDWASLTPVRIPNGERRMVLDGPTATVDLLHVHVTSLAAGQVSGEAVRHPRDELLIIKEGDVEVSLDGRTQHAGPGAVLFFASGAVTRLKNVGAGPATYYVIYYETPRTPKS